MIFLETVAAVQMKNVTKCFGEVLANNKVNLELRRGEILSLLGENGSGKTTLMNMLAGIYYPDDGQIYVNGRAVTICSPKDAFDLGIGMNAIWGAYLFGLLSWMYFYVPGLTRSSQELFKMLPYLVTIAVLIMHQVALAPCSPFSVSAELLRQSAILARQYGVRLHTHLTETMDEERYTLEHYHMEGLLV